MGPQQRQLFALKDGGTNLTKGRPIVIVSRTELNHGQDVIVVRFTSQPSQHPLKDEFCVPFYEGEFGLWSNCFAKADTIAKIQIAELDLRRGPIGTIDELRFAEIIEAVKWVLKIPDSTQ